MEFKTEAIGAKILETITAGLYDGNLNCLREYVQNSIDAEAKNIDIYFENDDNDLVIRDDGNGMNTKELTDALRVGVSSKEGDKVGWRGIGIWSGVSASHRIVIITKKARGKKLRIQVDCDKLRKGMSSNGPATEILTKSTGDIEVLPLGNDEGKDAHFTEIRLESMLRTQRGLFIQRNIYNYLARNVPAPFNKNVFHHSSEIEEHLNEQGVLQPSIHITSCGETVYRPPTDISLFFDKLIWKDFKVNDEVVATGWFITTDKNQVPKEPNVGIYFKKKGFTLGDSTLVRSQTDVTYNAWQYGEIHIVAKDLVENASRNNFESSSDKLEPFLEQVGIFVSQLQMMNRYQTGKTSPRLKKSISSAVQSGDNLKAKADIKKFKKKVTQPVSFPKDDSLSEMREVIDEASKKGMEEIEDVSKNIKESSSSPVVDKVALARAHYDNILDWMHPDIKDEMKKRSPSGRRELALLSTKPIRVVLQQKTKLNSNEIFDLSREAFDWEGVTGKQGRNPKITMTGQFDNTKQNSGRLAARNRRFGVLTYSIYDLMDNMSKHNSGKPEFAWLENIFSFDESIIGRARLLYKISPPWSHEISVVSPFPREQNNACSRGYRHFAVCSRHHRCDITLHLRLETSAQSH
ncbi:MAG: ATP-binding protein [Methanomassiliicoccales archaeon]|nr:ATP-binding protein [Methanomassiliicoccales archaeon]